jgi:hypothetical protein
VSRSARSGTAPATQQFVVPLQLRQTGLAAGQHLLPPPAPAHTRHSPGGQHSLLVPQQASPALQQFLLPLQLRQIVVAPGQHL